MLCQPFPPGENIHPLAEEGGGYEPEGVHDSEGVPLLLPLYLGLHHRELF